MIYPHTYKDGTLIIQINDNDEPLSEINIDKFASEILGLNTGNKKTILVDLKNKGYFNSSDLGALIKAKDILFDAGIELMLTNPSDNIKELLKIVGLSDFFGVTKENQ